MRFGVLVLFVIMAISACKTDPVAKKPISSIPMESVDAETNGERGGGTHFHIGPGEVFLDYTTLDSPSRATQMVDENRARGIRILAEGPVQGGHGTVHGGYVLVENESGHENTRYCLHWSKGARFHTVCSASTQPIEHFRASYEL